MAKLHRWSWVLVVPLLAAMGCTAVTVGDTSDTVQITIQARYEKRTLTTSGFGQVGTLPARYCWAEVWRSGESNPYKTGNLGTDGTGWVEVPRGTAFKVVVRADVTVPGTAGNTFFFHGSVKSGAIQNTYASANAFNQVQTWYMESLPQTAHNSLTVSLLAKENPVNADGNAGPFAIVDQMATFAAKTRDLEPTLPMPDLHAFWNTGNPVTAYPTAARDSLLRPLSQPSTTLDTDPVPGGARPIYQHEVRHAGPSAADLGADAYNDSLLQETFSRLFFSSGLIRSDNDPAAYINPAIASESTIAFASGFGNFLSCAFRNDPYLYDVDSSGNTRFWRLDQHQRPTYGGEFLGNSIARTLWGIWRNGSVFNGSQAGLWTLWDATNPSIANQPFEFGNAPLGCYPTYLVGLNRLATTQLGAAAGTAIRSELALENIGYGSDVTVPGGTYYTVNSANPLDSLWITENSLPISRSGSLKTFDSAIYVPIFYDQNQAQTYRIYHDGTNRVITLTTSSPGLLVELFDSAGYLAEAKAPSSANTISLGGRIAGYYAVRVRVDPLRTFTGADAAYTLTVQ